MSLAMSQNVVFRSARLLCWFVCLPLFFHPSYLFAAPNLLFNGSFEQGGTEWKLAGDARVERGPAYHGRSVLRLDQGSAQQDVSGLTPGSTFTCAAAIKVEEVRPSVAAGYAFIAIYQLDDFDDVIASHDFVRKTGSSGWQPHSYTFTLVEGCRTVSVRCGLFQAAGKVWCDGFTLVPGGQAVSWEQLDADRKERLERLGLETPSTGESKDASAHSEGNLAILKDDLPVSGAPSSPDYFARTLRQAGFRVAFLNAEQLADPHLLSRDNFEVIVLPYAASFPASAAETFRRFLRQGGKFFSTGGYAFDNLVQQTPAGWKPVAPEPPAMDSAIWRCGIPVNDLRGKGPITFSGFLRSAHIAGSGMAYFAVYQLASDGGLTAWKDVCQVRGTQQWKEFRHTFEVDPKTETVDLRAGLFQSRGVACFDDVRLTDASGHVLFNSDFEDPIDPDTPAARHWVRSSRQFCAVQTRTKHAGERALKVSLPMAAPGVEWLNTRHGIPGDGLDVSPGQMGVFDADYHLARANFATAAPEQCLFDPGTRIEGPLEGYAASGVVGFDQARWMPLLNTYDRYGRLRGAAGALLRHYAGPYAGSSWAFFGVTNRNLFAEAEAGMKSVLVETMRSLIRDSYIASLTSDRGCYRQGENVRLEATVFNGGQEDQRLTLELEVHEGVPATPRSADFQSAVSPISNRQPLQNSQAPPGSANSPNRPLATFSLPFAAKAGQTNLVSVEWKPGQFKSDFYHVTARLNDGGHTVDKLESGFVVWDEKVIASGPKLNLQRNYLRFGKRPLFLFGTDDWSYIFTTSRETPLQWLRDMEQRRDFGVLIYENLQFGIPASAADEERLLRKVDGVTQLAQKFQQVYLPGLLIGYNVAAGDTDLDRQKQFCRSFAQRYARVPGLVYYLNGDLACRLTEAVTPQWNEFLRGRYGTTASLRQAWGPRAPAEELGRIPAEDFNDWGHAWDNLKVYDLNLFRAWLIRSWSHALIAGIRECDSNHLTTAEFYQLPHQGVDLPAAIDEVDLANFGFFEKPNLDLQRFPALCKFNDQRWRGKSTGPGEYGVKTHPAWADGKDYGYHTARTQEQALEHYLAIPHYALGLGASRIHNWCWKDDAPRVFPWGLCYPCDSVPKDILYAHRNQSLLFRHFAPVYRDPAVYLLTADTHRFGGGKWQILDGILAGIDLALATHVENLGTLNEMNLQIPASARLIFFPLPYCISDDASEKLLRWVRQGGVLYLSGDLSFDQERRRTRTRRLEELCGVRFVAENYANIAVQAASAQDQPCLKLDLAGAKALRRSADGQPLVLDHALGKGHVIYTPDPIELHSTPPRRAQDVALYRTVLQTGGISPIGLRPDDPSLHVFRVPLEDGGVVYVLFNADETQASRQVTLLDPRPSITLDVARRRPALLWVDKRGAILAIENQGECRAGDASVLVDHTEGIALALDGQDLRRSHAVVLMPLKPGPVRLIRTSRWNQPVVETGEIRHGTWQILEATPLPSQAQDLQMTIQPDQALSLLLLCDSNDLPRWRAALARAMTDPASLP